MTPWSRRALLVVAGAALVHIAAVWALPRAIVAAVRHRLATDVGVNHVEHAPLPDEHWRTVVMPSPDLLYSAIAYDVSDGDVEIDAQVPDRYWSLSVFGANTDCEYVVDDRDVGAGEVRVVLTRRSGVNVEGARVVEVDSEKGVVLLRQLVLGREDWRMRGGCRGE